MARRSAVGVLNGNWKNRWRDIQSGEDRSEFIKAHNEEKFADALSVLKKADPDGWEKWFDDDANIPNVIYFSDSAAIAVLCSRMIERANSISSHEPVEPVH